MGVLDRKYREGVREYILGLTPERKKDFQYQLMRQVSLHRRDLRDMKELLAEELAALAFLEAEMYTIPFKRRATDESASIGAGVHGESREQGRSGQHSGQAESITEKRKTRRTA